MKHLLHSIIAIIAFATTQMSAMAQNDDNISIKTYTYAIKDKDTLRVDIYLREDLKDAENLPVMLYVHGGGFSAGSRKNAAQEIFIRHYAEQGYMGASIDYRLGAVESNPYGCKNMQEIIRLATTDMAEATRYLIDNFNIDPKRIITSGGSAGAITVLQIEYDLRNIAEYTKQILPQGFNYAGIIAAAGAIYDENNQPLYWPNAPCPMLIMQGDNDNVVPVDSANVLGLNMYGTKYLHRMFTEKNFPHWTYIEKGADHVVAMKHLTDNFELTDCFIRKFIDNKETQSVYSEWEDDEPANMADINAMIKYVPMYILGYDKYLKDLDFNSIEAPTEIKY